MGAQTPPLSDREQPGYTAAFDDWLPSFFEGLAADAPDGLNAEDLQNISVKKYLQASAEIEMPADDRLRFLAIGIEEAIEYIDVLIDPYGKWLAADRIFNEAIRVDPDYGPHHSSRGLSAHYMLHHKMGDKQRSELVAVAKSASLRGTELDPSCKAFSIAGQCHYQDDTTKSLELYEDALQLDSDALWPLLFRAHCLHDLERYAEAKAAYGQVPLGRLTGSRSWRLEALRNQLAACQLHLGELTEARAAFEAILNRYESQPHLAAGTPMRYLREAAEVWPELAPRIDAVDI